ncbi:MAG: hypothetical protein AB1689_19100, partial [Thermodesulfobacteriota bacterium]
ACFAAGRTSLVVQDHASDARDRLVWRWTRGDAVPLAALGDPLGGATSYALCVYETSAGMTALARPPIEIPGGGVCRGKPCWKALGGVGVKYADRDRTPDGVESLVLRSGPAGKPSVVLTAKGATLAPPSLPLGQDPAVTVQLVNDSGACFGAAYASPAQKNDAGQFRDKTP